MTPEQDESKYQGIHKYFNSYTIRGRSNWGKLCLGFYLFCFLTFKAVRSLKKKPTAEGNQQPTLQPAQTMAPQKTTDGVQPPPLEHQAPPSPPWTLPLQVYEQPCERPGQLYPPPPPGFYPYPYFPGQGAMPEGSGDRQSMPPYPCYPPPMYCPPGAYPPPSPPGVYPPPPPPGAYPSPSLPGTYPPLSPPGAYPPPPPPGAYPPPTPSGAYPPPPPPAPNQGPEAQPSVTYASPDNRANGIPTNKGEHK